MHRLPLLLLYAAEVVTTSRVIGVRSWYKEGFSSVQTFCHQHPLDLTTTTTKTYTSKPISLQQKSTAMDTADSTNQRSTGNVIGSFSLSSRFSRRLFEPLTTVCVSRRPQGYDLQPEHLQGSQAALPPGPRGARLRDQVVLRRHWRGQEHWQRRWFVPSIPAYIKRIDDD